MTQEQDRWTPLFQSLFLRDVWTVAKALLGKIIVTRLPEGETAVRITETEAYAGELDRACHAYGGRRTKRTEPMFKQGGTLYIYKCYGIHHMLNFVTGREGEPCAVLIRSGEPLWGIDLMSRRRRGAPIHRLTVGPGSLCAALGIPLEWSGQHALTHPNLFLYEDGYIPPSVAQGKRIGVEYAGPDAHQPWRYWIEPSTFVSHNSRKSITFAERVCE
ncbi:MAG: DNA-3-methyladenine glycosylase [Bacteroidia bacterium]|nr:DNA-3-methyladenine glycosylase [Bacteroidia bacterium]